jgi:hypothetical protein
MYLKTRMISENIWIYCFDIERNTEAGGKIKRTVPFIKSLNNTELLA